MNIKKQGVLFLFTFLFSLPSLFVFAVKPKNSTIRNVVPTVILPDIPLELPAEHFDLWEELELSTELLEIEDIFVTYDFTGEDTYQIKTTDPKLFAFDTKIILDLTQIAEEDYSFPLPGAKLISEYAGRRSNHAGIDLKTTSKDTVLAVFDGVVRIARSLSGYGNMIVIRHSNGLETLYSHNSKNLVKAGDRVKAGQPIGITGQTGRASTDHLHFETRINGQHFNPEILFNLYTQRLQEKTLVFKKEGTKVNIESLEVNPSYNYSYLIQE